MSGWERARAEYRVALRAKVPEGGIMSLTTAPADPGLKKILPSGQQEKYLVLSEADRAEGFVRPVRTKYIHLKCGAETHMGLALSETCARDPKFYGGTYCCHCGTHFPLRVFDPAAKAWVPAFVWVPDGDPVGSTADEAAEYFAAKAKAAAEANAGAGI